MRQAGVEANDNGRRGGFVEVPEDDTYDYLGTRTDRGETRGA